jgi:hypothetical protein
VQDQNTHTKIMRIAPETDRSTLTDAQLIAGLAGEALELGRYALAVELTRLADRAARVGVRPAGHDAAQREMFGPGADRVRDVPLIGQTRDEAPQRDMSRAPQVCAHRSEVNGSGVICHQPIAWAEGTGGLPGQWYHLDATITDHSPAIGY